MNNIEQYLLFLIVKFPFRYKLSISRLIKMLYLADWKNSLVFNNQLTEINWYYNTDGPFSSDIQLLLETSDKIKNLLSSESNDEEMAIHSQIDVTLNLSKQEKEILYFVIEKTKDLEWSDFNKLIYSTYPLMKQPKYSSLNLVELSREYLNLKK